MCSRCSKHQQPASSKPNRSTTSLGLNFDYFQIQLECKLEAEIENGDKNFKNDRHHTISKVFRNLSILLPYPDFRRKMCQQSSALDDFSLSTAIFQLAKGLQWLSCLFMLFKTMELSHVVQRFTTSKTLFTGNACMSSARLTSKAVQGHFVRLWWVWRVFFGLFVNNGLACGNNAFYHSYLTLHLCPSEAPWCKLLYFFSKACTSSFLPKTFSMTLSCPAQFFLSTAPSVSLNVWRFATEVINYFRTAAHFKNV